MTHGVQKIDGIAGKPADGFSQDDVNLPGITVSNKPLEFAPVLRACICIVLKP